MINKNASVDNFFIDPKVSESLTINGWLSDQNSVQLTLLNLF